jgi:hypothetical protein
MTPDRTKRARFQMCLGDDPLITNFSRSVRENTKVWLSSGLQRHLFTKKNGSQLSSTFFLSDGVEYSKMICARELDAANVSCQLSK